MGCLPSVQVSVTKKEGEEVKAQKPEVQDTKKVTTTEEVIENPDGSKTIVQKQVIVEEKNEIKEEHHESGTVKVSKEVVVEEFDEVEYEIEIVEEKGNDVAATAEFKFGKDLYDCEIKEINFGQAGAVYAKLGKGGELKGKFKPDGSVKFKVKSKSDTILCKGLLDKDTIEGVAKMGGNKGQFKITFAGNKYETGEFYFLMTEGEHPVGYCMIKGAFAVVVGEPEKLKFYYADGTKGEAQITSLEKSAITGNMTIKGEEVPLFVTGI